MPVYDKPIDEQDVFYEITDDFMLMRHLVYIILDLEIFFCNIIFNISDEAKNNSALDIDSIKLSDSTDATANHV